MTLDLQKISNQKIAQLVQRLPYLEIFPDHIAQNFIEEIASFPPEAEDKLIELLEMQVKTLPKLTEEEKSAIFTEEAENMLKAIKDFKKECLIEGEKIDKENSEQKQEDLLNQLEDL